MSLQKTVVNVQPLSEQKVFDGSVIPQEIIINNCLDVHIGPKYIHNNVIIKNGESCVGYKDAAHDDVLGYYKCLKCGIQLKIMSFGSILIIIIVTLLMRRTGSVRPGQQLEENNDDYPLDKRFVLREGWGAAPPCQELDNNTLPLEKVIFIHTVSSGTCNNFASCKQKVLDIQDMQMNECIEGTGLGDIGYNFVLGSDGHIFVGRGWDKIGAHTRGSNTGSIGVAFIGDFRRDEPSPAMLKSAKTLLEVGVNRSKLSIDYQLFGHCQVHSGFPYSPGVNILSKIELWPHWNNTKSNQCSNFIPSNNATHALTVS